MSPQAIEPSLSSILSDESPVSVAELLGILTAVRGRLRGGKLSEAEATRFASWASSQFWLHYRASGSLLTQAVTLLCELAIQTNPDVARAGRRALFSSLVEPLSDAFDAECCAVYDRMFAQVIDWCQRQPAGAALHRALTRFGLRNADHLVTRKYKLDRQPLRRTPAPQRVKKVFLLSRVTLGAEVAITATIMATLRGILPAAEYVLLAASTVRRLFAGDERVSVHEVRHNREQGLIEQFDAWLDVIQAIRTETEGLHPEEFLVIDPDSRLSQLGLLPVMEDEASYVLFPSRSFGGQGEESLGALAARWTAQTFGAATSCYPQLSLPAEDWDLARALVRRLTESSPRPVTVVNFGVGGNSAKRLSEPFEHKLVLKLIENGNCVLLAKGVGPEETDRSNRLLRTMAESGKIVQELDASRPLDLAAIDANCDVLGWQGNVGAYCALIGSADDYIGYDSAGQHIAAALGTPTTDIFAHSPSPLFMHRWRPYGPGAVQVVDATRYHSSPDYEAIERFVQQVMEHRASRCGMKG